MRFIGLSCLCLVSVSASSVQAQSGYPSPYGTGTPYPSPYPVQPPSDADRLASEVRLLAANPQDLDALVRAGELAVKIGDATAAATFFARAERIDPRNPRVKAGEASLLVSAERPGEALRRFGEAEALGGDVRAFAADRGLAYDLIGEQDRAQRDYRLALRGGANDETQRRYALSLGISGKRELALAQIDPLLRKSDRGAWRARAFILAMGGDQPGAERIATSMMPGGLAQGLGPFFALLPTLRPADRAFAVHFGEVRTSPERQFDARLVPPLAVLAPDPTAPVVLAALARPAAPVREGRKERKRRDRVELAMVPPPPALVPPVYRAPIVAVPTYTAPPTVVVTTAPAPVPYRSTVATAPIALPPARVPVPTQVLPVRAPPVEANTMMAASPQLAPATVAMAPQPLASTPAAERPAVIAAPPARAVAQPPVAVPVQRPVVIAAATPVTAAAPPPAPVVVAAPSPTPAPVRSEESILASILADIKVPPSELEGSATEPAAVPVAAAKAEVLPPPDTREADKKAADKKIADKKAADKKLADKKLADKKLTEAKVLADKKAAEEKKKHDPKLLEPSRIWVQVAGGATERDLPKEWARVRGKSTAAFKGRQGWTTPLRATNRVLTGPFKSETEAQAFVNSVAKDGISGFVFISEAGQKIDKLPSK